MPKNLTKRRIRQVIQEVIATRSVGFGGSGAFTGSSPAWQGDTGGARLDANGTKIKIGDKILVKRDPDYEGDTEKHERFTVIGYEPYGGLSVRLLPVPGSFHTPQGAYSLPAYDVKRCVVINPSTDLSHSVV